VIGTDDRIVDLNTSAERLLGRARTESLGQSPGDIGWPIDPEERQSVLDELRRSGISVGRTHLRRSDGEVREIYRAGALIEVAGRSYAFWIARDVTGQHLSDAEAAELQESMRRSIAERRRLITRLIHVTDQERARLADELRAGPIQRLTASQLMIEVAQADADAEQRRRLEDVQGSIAATIRDLRRITMAVRPPVLQREGLGPAVRALLVEFQETYGVPSHLEDRMAGDPASPDAEAIAYRVIFDVLMVVRDAGARERVLVTLELDGEDIAVAIVVQRTTPEPGDLGIASGLGLETLRDLLSDIGGSLDVSTAPSGMVISATIPRILA
jgi:PAS domain S-box-containing protein